MNKSKGKNCGLFVIAAAVNLFSVHGSWAQDSNASGAMGGLRGPQDILNSVNNRDSYGNPMPNVPGTYGSPSAGAEAPGAIQPFTNASDPNAGSQGAYLPPPAAGSGASSVGAGSGGNYSSVQGNTPPFQGGPPQSYKAHHHHSKKQTAFQQSQAGSQFNGQGGPGQYPNPNDPSGQQGYNPGGQGGYPNPGMSGPPDATQYHSHSGAGGNNSLGGAVVGVPDRAAKTAVGGSLKAGKEVLKALF